MIEDRAGTDQLVAISKCDKRVGLEPPSHIEVSETRIPPLGGGPLVKDRNLSRLHLIDREALAKNQFLHVHPPHPLINGSSVIPNER